MRPLDRLPIPVDSVGTEADYSLGCPVVQLGVSAYTWDSAEMSNDFELPAGSCYDGSTAAVDVVWEFWLDAWEPYYCVVSRGWYPAGQDEMREFEPVYLLDDCRPLPTSCVAIAEQVGNHAVSLSYVATQAGFYYLVHDADGAIHDNLVEHHKTLDTSPPPPPAHDDCGDARWLNESSFDLVDDLSAARNQFDPGRQGCSGPGGTGRDVVYRVVLLAGSAIDVTMTPVGGWDAELYLVSDCGDPVAGGEPDGEGGQRLVHVAADGGNFYLVCDSYGIGPRPFTLRGNHGGPAVDVPANDGALALEACWPNPFNPRTTLRCSLPAPGEVSLCIFDLAGRRIAQLASGPQDAGPHEAVFDGRDDLGRALPAGTYMCRLEAAGQSRTTKLVLVR